MIIAQDIDFIRDCFHASRIGDYGQVKRIPCGINRQARTRVIHAISGLDPYGIPRSSLSRLHSKGKLKKSGRGLYVLANSHATEHRSLAEVSKRVPKGVICLLSALRFHELTTESPFEIWVAIGSNAWRPKIEYPPVQIVHFSPSSLKSGVEQHLIEGVNVPIYSPAKTVADCFKYRNKIGVNIAIEALQHG